MNFSMRPVDLGLLDFWADRGDSGLLLSREAWVLTVVIFMLA
jgi:hypothetical protein